MKVNEGVSVYFHDTLVFLARNWFSEIKLQFCNAAKRQSSRNRLCSDVWLANTCFRYSVKYLGGLFAGWAVTEVAVVKGIVWGWCLVGNIFQFTDIIVFILSCTGAFASMWWYETV